jgi:fumarate hydratase class II
MGWPDGYHQEGTTLREAAMATGYVTAVDFDKWAVPEHMIGVDRPKRLE